MTVYSSNETDRMKRARRLEGREPTMDEIYDEARRLITKIDAITIRGNDQGKLTPEITVLAELANALHLLSETRGYPPAVWHTIPFRLALTGAKSAFEKLRDEPSEKPVEEPA